MGALFADIFITAYLIISVLAVIGGISRDWQNAKR